MPVMLRILTKKIRAFLLCFAFLLFNFLCLSLPGHAFGSESITDERGWRISVGLTYGLLDEDEVEDQGLGDSAFGVDIAVNYYFSSRLVGRIGFGVFTLEDNAAFEQLVETTTIFGSDVETAQSDSNAIPLFVELNYQSAINAVPGVRFRAGAGFTGLVRAERSISNCEDCREDDLDIDGGAFVSGTVFRHRASSKFGLTVQQYLSGDFRNTISFWYEF